MSEIKAAAQLLCKARKGNFRLYDIPQAIRPKSVQQGYLVQKELETLLNKTRIGFKAGNTNKSSQIFLNLKDPFYGPLLSPLVVGTQKKPALVDISKFNVRLCEPEFALLVGENSEIIECAPAIEIVHSSFLDWKSVGVPSLIADLACNGTWIVGESQPISKVKLERCSLKVNGKQVAVGSAENVLGSPFNVFENLKHVFEIPAGTWITTGVCVDPPYHYCEKGDIIEAEFSGGLGIVALKCL